MTNQTLKILEAGRILKSVVRDPYVWPGGYEVVAFMDGECMCYVCLKERFKEELWNAAYVAREIGKGVIWEGDAVCEHCNRSVAQY